MIQALTEMFHIEMLLVFLAFFFLW